MKAQTQTTRSRKAPASAKAEDLEVEPEVFEVAIATLTGAVVDGHWQGQEPALDSPLKAGKSVESHR
ncbi:hypothetical protein JCM19235_4003 [Vibrio maritimus]|uniref:Uncharacterized protein n=1 Tax=Vibrio maritimus TaxID=990268 RepID=A0A090ST34_9VIBR|nr:hypothetical protein JCM19235_4003 [Vibrio maritimus]